MKLDGEVVAKVVDEHDLWPQPLYSAARRSTIANTRVVALVLDFHPVLAASKFLNVVNAVLSNFKRALWWIFTSPIHIKILWRVTHFRSSNRLGHL